MANERARLQAIDDCDLFTFRVMSRGGSSSSTRRSLRSIDIPPREDALLLFKDYLDKTDFYIANLIDYPSAQATIHRLYMQLRQGQKVSLASVAFVLSFCAASAFFWDQETSSDFKFSSEEDAAASSHAWRASAFDLLDQSQRAALNSLDAVVARLVLADLIYNMEGTSSRFRYTQSGARATAYEMGLHLVDLPGREDADTEIYREMKRRVWWYLAAMDWLLGTMGGPSGRIYTVNPRHMVVNYPRYLPESDPMIARYGAWAETALLHLNMRIRLAETCREVVDALPLGFGDIDSLPYAKITALDRLFEQLQLEIPTVISAADINSLGGPAQTVALQRSIGTLSLHARWARLLRPLLQANRAPKRFENIRKRCLSSTETVIDIASTILSAAVDSPRLTDVAFNHITSRRSPYRSGLVINHLFMACTVLATDPALRENAGTGESAGADAGTERRRAALANACRLLKKAGEKSSMAAAMVRRLVGVLRKHRVHGVEGYSRNMRNDDTFVSGMLVTQDKSSGETLRQALPMTEISVAQSGQEGSMQGWRFEDGMMDPVGLGGIWYEYFETDPPDDGWEQLFADLDSLAGGV